jgi:hypothetical protein
MIHIDFSVTDNCNNLESSYGEICVKCNACGRFNEDEDICFDEEEE